MKNAQRTVASSQAVIGTIQHYNMAIQAESSAYGYRTQYAAWILEQHPNRLKASEATNALVAHARMLGSWTDKGGPKTVTNAGVTHSHYQQARFIQSVESAVKRILDAKKTAAQALEEIAAGQTVTPEPDKKEDAGKAKVVNDIKVSSAKDELARILSEMMQANIEGNQDVLGTLIAEAQKVLITM